MSVAPAPCFFCGGSVEADVCTSCGVSASAPRRLCDGCQKVIQAQPQTCPHCGLKRGSEMVWKIPLIIAMFLVAIIVSVLAQLF